MLNMRADASASSVCDATPADTAFALAMFTADPEDRWRVFIRCACDALPLIKSGVLDRDLAVDCFAISASDISIATTIGPDIPASASVWFSKMRGPDGDRDCHSHVPLYQQLRIYRRGEATVWKSAPNGPAAWRS